MLCFRPPNAWVIGSPKCSVFAFNEDYSLSVSISTRSYSSVRFFQRLYPCHDVIRTNGYLIFSLCLGSGSSMQPANICPHHQRDEYPKVTYLLTSRHRFDTYSITDTICTTLYQTCETAEKLDMMAMEKRR